jgi:CDP-diacylglycerol--glycerol-3-phosphate 3-phosphatidyltransferase
MRINIPNQITLARLVLALVFFALLSRFSAARLDADRWLLAAGFWIFLVAVVSDVVDGLLARIWKQTTAFGRVIDPVVDKVLICGAFLFLASDRFYEPSLQANITGVTPWMATVILARELLVSALRMRSESRGRNFAANWAGKTKMVVQSAAICAVLARLAWLEALTYVAPVLVWTAVVITILSVVPYLLRAGSPVSAAQARVAAHHNADRQNAVPRDGERAPRAADAPSLTLHGTDPPAPGGDWRQTGTTGASA